MEQLKAVVALFIYRKLEFLNEILDEIKKYDPPKVYIFQNKYFNETEDDLLEEDFDDDEILEEVEIIEEVIVPVKARKPATRKKAQKES